MNRYMKKRILMLLGMTFLLAVVAVAANKKFTLVIDAALMEDMTQVLWEHFQKKRISI